MAAWAAFLNWSASIFVLRSTEKGFLLMKSSLSMRDIDLNVRTGNRSIKKATPL
jgi:hypothetical protein